MRIKNKEIRARRHRKEQKIKEAEKAVRLQYADKKDAPKPTAKAPAKPAAKKPAPKKKEGE
ncbi:MAG TPA: hypothetical protein VG944_02115 [Fimbriimonas sp.]|nr:hypothetical protein [Fimbriimonas sp.]